MLALSWYETVAVFGESSFLHIYLQGDTMVPSFYAKKLQLLSSFTQLLALKVGATSNQFLNVKQLLLECLITCKLLKCDHVPIHIELSCIFSKLSRIQNLDYAEIGTFNAIFNSRHCYNNAIKFPVIH